MFLLPGLRNLLLVSSESLSDVNTLIQIYSTILMFFCSGVSSLRPLSQAWNSASKLNFHEVGHYLPTEFSILIYLFIAYSFFIVLARCRWRMDPFFT